MSRKTRAFLAVILAAILSGGNPTFTKIGLNEFPPLGFIFVRFLISLVFVSAILVKGLKKARQELLPIVLLSLLSTANIVLFTFGVKRTTATMSQMIYAVVPILAAVLSAKLLKEAMTVRKIGGIVLGLVGMALIVLLPLINHSTASSGDLVGNLMIVLGAVSFSVYSVYSKRFQEKYSPAFLTAIFLLTTALVSGILAFGEYLNNPDLWGNISVNAWLAMGYVALLGTGSFYFLYQFAIQAGSPVIASMILYLAPVTAFGWAFFLLGERLTTTIVAGAILVLSGAWLVTGSNRVQSR